VKNELLAALPDIERERLIRDLTPVHLSLGEVLYEPVAPRREVYFPTSAVVSLSYVRTDGTSAEVAIIGNEGVVGVGVALADSLTPSRAVVWRAGWAYRLMGRLLSQDFAQAGAMQQLLFRYARALVAQKTRTAMCNSQHPVDQQLCRWLLLRLDRMGTDEITMTPEAVADAVGVPTAGVVAALRKLRSAGLVHYSGGHITIVSRAGLEHRACECYGVVARELGWCSRTALTS
jgi:CRP-like cAMP-binding protein